MAFALPQSAAALDGSQPYTVTASFETVEFLNLSDGGPFVSTEMSHASQVYARYHAFSPQTEGNQWRLFGRWGAAQPTPQSSDCGDVSDFNTNACFQVMGDSGWWPNGVTKIPGSPAATSGKYSLADISTCQSHTKPDWDPAIGTMQYSGLDTCRDVPTYSKNANKISFSAFPGQPLTVQFEAEDWDASSLNDPICKVSKTVSHTATEMNSLNEDLTLFGVGFDGNSCSVHVKLTARTIH
ncbi:hypothetical protein ACFV2Z_34485 [Streptomyces sp. NPDC059688]|uniref:hypothetical protein n=1 Tax=Streptomyces sp. NPDC059688 TaxID=3346906 RepID=UPI0036B7D367